MAEPTARPACRRPLDRVNPATRLLLAVILSLPLVVTLDWVSASVALLLEAALAVVCGVGARRLLRNLLPLFVVAPIGAVSMLLYGQRGGHVWWHWGPATISDNSIRLATALFIRVFALALPAAALFRDVDATRMADGLAQVAHLPSRFVLGTLAGFRMIGLFTDDWRTLGHARRARGLGDEGRLRRWALMSFSLLVLALRRGSRLATAMEAKGFGGTTRRTWARPSRVGAADAVAVAACLLVGAASLAAAWRCGTLLTVLS